MLELVEALPGRRSQHDVRVVTWNVWFGAYDVEILSRLGLECTPTAA